MDMLRLENIHKTFGRGNIEEKKALRGLNLHLKEGDFVTIIGSNGAGKSTLFNTISGKYPIDEGSIYLDNEDITDISEHKRARGIGRLMQDPLKGTAPSLTILENLALAYGRTSCSGIFAANKKDVGYFKDLLSSLELGLEDRIKTPVGNLSGGQRQAVTLLMCTISSPKLLLLDEHTAALDPVNAKKITDITERVIKEANITAMMITHDIREALRIGNRTIVMDDGEIILDIKGEERKGFTLENLLTFFKGSRGNKLADDRILLS
jgi:putative ABC transport system ATP-binding protein